MNKHAGKPTLLELRRQTPITSHSLAQEAGVTLGQEYAVEVGGFVKPEIAEKVVAAFSRLTQKPCTIHDIALNNQNKRWTPSSDLHEISS